MTTPPTHDDLGRHVQAFLAGEAATGLPRGAALLAYARHHGLDAVTLAGIHEIVVMVETAERSTGRAA